MIRPSFLGLLEMIIIIIVRVSCLQTAGLYLVYNQLISSMVLLLWYTDPNSQYLRQCLSVNNNNNNVK